MGARTITFGAFEFSPDTGELRHRGKRVRLQNQSAELLRALLEHPGELVPREDLRRRIWADGSFTDFEQGLNRAAHRLRLALGDSTRNPNSSKPSPGAATALSIRCWRKNRSRKNESAFCPSSVQAMIRTLNTWGRALRRDSRSRSQLIRGFK
jgi:hypothetical protein